MTRSWLSVRYVDV